MSTKQDLVHERDRLYTKTLEQGAEIKRLMGRVARMLPRVDWCNEVGPMVGGLIDAWEHQTPNDCKSDDNVARLGEHIDLVAEAAARAGRP